MTPHPESPNGLWAALGYAIERGPMRPKTQIWLHKPTNTRHYIAGSNGAAFLMQALSRNPRYATEAELNNAAIWSKV